MAARYFLALIATISLGGTLRAAEAANRFVDLGPDGKLVYQRSPRGDRIPDFSHAGFGGGDVIPEATIAAVVNPAAGDAGPRIQAAIDAVAKLPAAAGGLRGEVLLPAGSYEISGSLRLASGVVLRGQGEESVLVATGNGRRAVVQFCGGREQTLEASAPAIADEYVPVGSYQVRLNSTAGLSVGDMVLVEHPSTREWIAALGMNRFPSRDQGSYLDWRPGTLDLRWDRVIQRIDGETVTLDAPLTSALDRSLSPSGVRKYTWPNRLRLAGVENLRIESQYNAQNPHDEEHAWTGVLIENAEDVWVRRVSFAHLAGSAVAVWETAKRVTVADCSSTEPISELGGHRRLTFFTAGQQTLFLRCRAEGGRHDFTTGHLACGPNAFVDCRAVNAHGFSGPSGSWASGVLFDNVQIDGGGLALTNRETDDQGVGWAAANSVIWQCVAPVITCRAPPTAQNWAIGVWGQFVGDGHWRELNEFSKPDSLHAQQLRERLGERAAGVLKPTEIAAEIPADKAIRNISEALQPTEQHSRKHSLALKNGWLTVDDAVLTGGRQGTAWWRGHTLPSRETEVGLGVTRYVPGRTGPGRTDDLAELAAQLKSSGAAALDHHWGLWYDRRRDDHQMLRRMDGEVWAPFYEHPWARSGQGLAWDGLSRYDLTRFNPWYFARLSEFADECQRQGIVLVQQMYFQHNILEAGAHWAEFPWRPANCLQATGFPEPPEYVGKKRVFMADAFYDVTHPERRKLHEQYIRHCLDVLGDKPNVVFQTGEEFSGPLHFVQFWLDTVAQWSREHDRRVLVGLSCTKDVQDAILADPQRAPLVSVIDIKYWWYASDGKAYDPPGGENLAPRQQLREWKGNKSRSPASIARAVREYRTRFPDKAITVSLDGAAGWNVLAAGGSLPALPRGSASSPDHLRLLAALPKMGPVTQNGRSLLAEPGKEYLISTEGPAQIDLSSAEGGFMVRWIDPRSGRLRPIADRVAAGKSVELTPPDAATWILWLSRS